MMKPVKSGIYEINDQMISDLIEHSKFDHHVNLGGLISKEIADEFGKKAYMADPVVVDELNELALPPFDVLAQQASLEGLSAQARASSVRPSAVRA